MNGWLIYSKKDIDKNRFFIDALCSEFKKYDVSLKLKIYENADWAFLLRTEKPYFVINRSRFFDISEYLESKSIRVFNRSLVTKLANDKLATYQYFKDVAPTMPTVAGDEYVSGFFEYPIVIKSISGHGGDEVFLANNATEESAAIKKLNDQQFIVQQCCDTPGKDVRIYILGNKILSAVLRTSEHDFKSNYSLGGDAELYTLNDNEMNLVDSILCKLYFDYAGIDFIFHKNHLILNEIEDAAGARMLYKVSDINIASSFVRYIMSEINPA